MNHDEVGRFVRHMSEFLVPFRFRPFGVVGSGLEILFGLLVLRDVLWTREDYSGWFQAGVVAFGTLVFSIGVLGVASAFLRAHGHD